MPDIDKISLEIESESKQASAGIDSLISSLTKLSSVSSSVSRDLNKIDRSLKKLVTTSKDVNKINFTGLQQGLNSISRSLGRVNQDANGMAALSTQLKGLSSGLNSVRNSLTKISNGSLSLNKANISEFTTQLRDLSKLSTYAKDFEKFNQGAKQFRSSLTTLTNSSKKLAELIDNINKLENLDRFESQVKSLVGPLNSLATSMDKVSTASKGFATSMNKVPSSVDKASKSLDKAQKSFKDFSGATDFLSTVYMLEQVGRGFAYPIREANKYIETLNLFNVVMGDSSEKATQFIASLESVGVDMEQAMRYQSSFYDIAKSMGVASDNAYTLSEQFTKLTYDYASLYNLNVEDSFTKLQSAITGELEPIRRLGKDISEARLQQIALDLGIQQSVRTMSQAEKAELRFIAVMQQSGAAMNDLERTINAPANSLRVLRAQFTTLAREIGALFIPILTAVLPYLIAIVKVLRSIVATIAGLFGIDMFETKVNDVSSSVGSVGDSMGDVADNAGDASDNLGSAGDKAKKLKDYLLGIDELNVINPDLGSAGGGGASGGGGGGGVDLGGEGLGLDLDDYGYKKLLEEVNQKAEEIYQTLKKFEPLLLTLGALFSALWAWAKLKKFLELLNLVNSALGGMPTKGPVVMDDMGKSMTKLLTAGKPVPLLLSDVSTSMSKLGNNKTVPTMLEKTSQSLGKLANNKPTPILLSDVSKKMLPLGTPGGATSKASSMLDKVKNALKGIGTSQGASKTIGKLSDDMLKLGGSKGAAQSTTILDKLKNLLKGISMQAGVSTIFSKLSTALGGLGAEGGAAAAATGALSKLSGAAKGAVAAIGGTGAAGLSLVLSGLALAGATVVTGLQPAVKQFEVLGNNISDVTKEKLGPFIETWNSLESQMNEIRWSEKIVTQEEYDSVMTKVVGMRESVLNEIDADRNQALKDIELLKNIEGISDETYQSMIQKTNQQYDQMGINVTDAEAKIKEILSQAKDEKRTLKEEEVQEILELQEQIRDNGVRTMTETQTEQEEILRMLKVNSKNITVEMGSEMLIAAKKNSDDQVTEAESWKERMLEKLDLYYADEESKSSEEYKRQKKDIEDAYNKMVKEAEDGYDEIYKKVEKGLGDQADLIDRETGKIKTKFETFIDGLKSAWESFWNIFKSDENLNLNDPTGFWGGSLPKNRSIRLAYDTSGMSATLHKFARGGFVPAGANFVSPDSWTAGEAGRELIGSYRGRTTVMPLENTSFVQAMYQAVYDATRSAYSENEMTVVVKPEVKLDSKDIAQGQKEYKYKSGSGLVRKI